MNNAAYLEDVMPNIKMPEWIAGLVVWAAITLTVTYLVMSHRDVAWVSDVVSKAWR